MLVKLTDRNTLIRYVNPSHVVMITERPNQTWEVQLSTENAFVIDNVNHDFLINALLDRTP